MNDQISIMSTVTNEYLMFEKNFLTKAKIDNFEIIFCENDFEMLADTSILKKWLPIIAGMADGIIEKRIQPIVSKFIPLTEYEYKNKKMLLALKDGDFDLAIIICFYNIINRTIDKKGHLFIYNRNFIKNNLFFSVLGAIKNAPEITIYEIEEKIKQMEKDYDPLSTIVNSDIKNHIEFLYDRGFIDLIGSNYRLTGRGYIFTSYW